VNKKKQKKFLRRFFQKATSSFSGRQDFCFADDVAVSSRTTSSGYFEMRHIFAVGTT
jgi:hypothetical protein